MDRKKELKQQYKTDEAQYGASADTLQEKQQMLPACGEGFEKRRKRRKK